MSTFSRDAGLKEKSPATRAEAAKALHDDEPIKAALIFAQLGEYERAARAFEKSGDFAKALEFSKKANNKIDSMRLANLLEKSDELARLHAENGNLEKAKLICKEIDDDDLFETLLFEYGCFDDVFSYGARKTKLKKTIQVIKDRKLGSIDELKALGEQLFENRSYKRAFICFGAADHWEGLGMAGKKLRRHKDAGFYLEKAGLYRQASSSYESAGMIPQAFSNLARANPSAYSALAKLQDFAERMNDEERLKAAFKSCLANECWNSVKALSRVLDEPAFEAMFYLQGAELEKLSRFLYRIDSLDDLESIAEWAWKNERPFLFAQAFLKNHTVCFPSWAKERFHKDTIPFFFKCIETYLKDEASADELILFLLMVQKRDHRGFLVCWILEILEYRELYSEMVGMLEWVVSSPGFKFVHAHARTQLSRKTYKGRSLAWRYFLSKDDEALLELLTDLDNDALTIFFSSHLNSFEHLANLIYKSGYDEGLVAYLKEVSPEVLGMQAALHRDYKTAGEAYFIAQDYENALVNAQAAEDSYVELGTLLALRKRTLIYEFLKKPRGLAEAEDWLNRKPINNLEKRTRTSFRNYVQKNQERARPRIALVVSNNDTQVHDSPIAH